MASEFEYICHHWFALSCGFTVHVCVVCVRVCVSVCVCVCVCMCVCVVILCWACLVCVCTVQYACGAHVDLSFTMLKLDINHVHYLPCVSILCNSDVNLQIHDVARGCDACSHSAISFLSRSRAIGLCWRIYRRCGGLSWRAALHCDNPEVALRIAHRYEVSELVSLCPRWTREYNTLSRPCFRDRCCQAETKRTTLRGIEVLYCFNIFESNGGT
jgi:hypothetical protein